MIAFSLSMSQNQLYVTIKSKLLLDKLLLDKTFVSLK